jgi:hypothetical protein
MQKRLPYLTILFLLTCCAISRKVDYDGVIANVPAFNESICIATWDQREQIVKGARQPDFVGYTRSGAGIAYPMGTASGRPLSDVISSDISNSLAKKGNKTSVVATSSTQKEKGILDQLKKSRSNKLILIKCIRFHTDGYGAQALLYQLQMNIYSTTGEILKQKDFSGKRELGGSVAWGPGKYKQYMPEACKKLLEEIFNDPEIVLALQ